MQDLVGLHEITKEFGVPTSTASSWTRQHSFPPPHLKLAMGPIWRIDDVKEWHYEKYGTKKPEIPVVKTKAKFSCPTCGSEELQASYMKLRTRSDFRILECPAAHQLRVVVPWVDNPTEGSFVHLEDVTDWTDLYNHVNEELA